MKTIKRTDIVIPKNRQRAVNEKKVKELTESISIVGLLQPIVLRNDGVTLVCGEHRITALDRHGNSFLHDGQTVGRGDIPYVLLGDLPPEQVFLAELDENLKRSDLTWQERARALAQLHEFRKSQNPKHTVSDTAREVREKPEVTGTEITEVSNAVILAKYLDDPIVAACPDEKSARKAIKDEVQRQERQRRLQTLDFTQSRHVLHVSSCYTDHVPEGTFDCIVTDPPYGIDIHKKDTFDSDKHEYDDSDAAFQEVCEKLPVLAARACKTNAHIYVFCDIRRFNELLVAFELGGWACWPRPLIWDKGNTGSFGNIEYGFRSCYDAILFARRGDKKVTAGYRDVIPITQPTNLPHPAGKPAELYIDLLRRSTLPGDVVGDFYCGHGPIFKAAEKLKLTAHGWEKNEKYAQLSQETLAEISGDKVQAA